ncbi:MAG TPA: CHC2 zinc finger domain-containing protein, partial [candidate division Zixibacteria bacterium]
MPGFCPPELIDRIRDASDIVDVISEYVPLKKRGKNYLGLCPFHAEKDASFTVTPQ